MSKPILSDLEYNASDVASAILSEADLSLTNEELGVTDRGSDFSLQSGWAEVYKQMYSFNGFMFVMFYAYHSGGTPDHAEAIYVNSNSDTRPDDIHVISLTGVGGDTATQIRCLTNGNIDVSEPVNEGSTNYYVTVNGWYRF